jgi:deazaflavin-dependent oxidoreductase (nitroreductase family)
VATVRPNSFTIERAHGVGGAFEPGKNAASNPPVLEQSVPEVSKGNAAIVEEFRNNGGKVGGDFEGAPMVLVHHRGRKSGEEYVTPMMYLEAEDKPGAIYVFASKAGAPDNPDWYYNLADAEAASIDTGTEAYRVTVTEINGEERDRIFAEQARRYPGFKKYEHKTEGDRTIPVLAMRRLSDGEQ